MTLKVVILANKDESIIMILLDVHVFSLTIGNPVPMSGNLSFIILCRKRLGRSTMVKHHEGCSSRTRGGEQGIAGGM